MTVQVLENFISPSYTDTIIKLYSNRLSGVESRNGFFEDLYISRNTLKPVPIENKHETIFENNETNDDMQAISMINNIIYLAKKEIENFYRCGPLTEFEGGMVMLTKGASNGLHSDIYELDGSIFEDESDRGPWLKYSALLYMSDIGADFTGGEIYFPKQNLEIGPKKGLLTFFEGDLEHVHEVREVTGGKRYAIVMFFGQ